MQLPILATWLDVLWLASGILMPQQRTRRTVLEHAEQKKRPAIPDIIPLLREYYQRPGNAVGGHFHVILDDGNHEQYFADSALAQAKELGDPLTIKVAEVLAEMSSTQRRKLSHCSFLWEMTDEQLEHRRQKRNPSADATLSL